MNFSHDFLLYDENSQPGDSFSMVTLPGCRNLALPSWGEFWHFWTTFYGRPPASWPTAIIFHWGMFLLSSYFIFSPPNLGGLRGRADRHQTATCSVVTLIYEIKSEIWGSLPQKKFGCPKTSKFRTSRCDREYLRKGTRYHRSENRVGNCKQIWWTLVHKRRKNRTGISTYSIDFFGCSYLRG